MSRAVHVVKEECTGCTLCEQTAPDVFRMDEAGLSDAYEPTAGADDLKQQAIDECPASCIHWTEE